MRSRGWKFVVGLWLIGTLLLCGCGGLSGEKPVEISAAVTEIQSAESDLWEEESSTEDENCSEQESSEEEDYSEKENGSEEEKQENGELRVTFLDVGQGTSVLLQSGEHAMLYDGGPAARSSYVVSYLRQQGITQLDYLVASHYDEDHIAGLVGVLHVFPVKTVLNPAESVDTDIYRSYEKMRNTSGAAVESPAIGTEYSLGSAEFTIVTPVGNNYTEYNNSSLGILVENGKNRFLFLGDAEFESEYDLLDSGTDIRADVYLVSHHGSSSSSSERLLKAVDPEAVVISCGTENTYGHPAGEVMERLKEHGYYMYRTDLQGAVTMISDGDTIWVDREACTDYRSGAEVSVPADISRDGSSEGGLWIGNVNTHKLHKPSCKVLPKEKNRVYFDSLDEALQQQYVLAQCCN